jgi:hypothetical protein
MAPPATCSCGSGHIPTELKDGDGTFLCYACEKCRKQKLAQFRDILKRLEIDEPVAD